MRAKVFDPMDEQTISSWLASEPEKVVLTAQVYDSRTGGVPRQVALVLYDEFRGSNDEEASTRGQGPEGRG